MYVPIAPLLGGLKGPTITNLQNHLLVATHALDGTFFDHAVIYVCTHTPQGTMGVVINKPMQKITFGAIASSMGIEDMLALGRGEEPTIFKGGPVEENRGFVLHTRDYTLPTTVAVGPQAALSATHDIVTDIAQGAGPTRMNFCLGYAGWSPGQIEKELTENAWLVVPADETLLFETPIMERHTRATHKLGVDTANFIDTIGLA